MSRFLCFAQRKRLFLCLVWPVLTVPKSNENTVHMKDEQRVILHVDMDAFFASVEQVDAPELRGKPVIIGQGHRGVVSTASYEARVFGVHSAMPVATARRLCPQGVFLPGRRWRYKEVSHVVMDIFRTVSPLVEQVSVDEAYIDVTGTSLLFGAPRIVAQHIKSEVLAATGLTCSVGIAPNKFLAKIASDMNKPDGIYEIRPEDVTKFLETLPVGKIPGIGPKAREALSRYGISKAGDVLQWPRGFWEKRFGKMGTLLHDRAQGIDLSPVVVYHEPKSSSAENTLEEDTTDRELLLGWLWRHAERVGHDLRRHKLRGRTVTLKLKFDDFSTRTRSQTLARRTDETRMIFDVAAQLFQKEALPRRVRLIGVGVSNFRAVPRQLSLFEEDGEEKSQGETSREKDLDRTIDAIREKFGRGAVLRGPSVKKPK